MTQLPVKNTFIEVRAQDPIIVRPRAQTAEVVASPSYLASSVEIAPAIAPVSAVAPGVPAVSVDSKVRTVPGAAACAISTGDSIRRCSVTRTPEVLYARTPVGSIAAEPPYAFALPQAVDEYGRRRTSTFGTEAARVQTGHSSATRRSSLETIPATPDLYYSWPPPNPAPPPVVMLPSAVPEGSTQVAQALPQLATHGMPILQCPPSHCQVQMPLQATPSETSYTQPVAHTVSAQYPSLGHQFAAPPIPLGSHAPLPPQWDAPLHFIPQSLSPMVQEPGKPIHKAAAPAWPAHPGKYQAPGGPVPQQVLVLSNFLQEAPRKLEAQLPAEVQDPAPGGITTLMLRNIPVTFNRESLLADFDVRGFRGKYDFFYLPIDFQTDNNLGYAFINLATPMYAEHFRSTYQGLALAGDRSKKICAVAPATTQGRAANVEYYRNSNVMSMEDKYQPLVFENGLRAPFPAPTKAVKPIRYRESRGMGPE